jgi:hypothetical protein
MRGITRQAQTLYASADTAAAAAAVQGITGRVESSTFSWVSALVAVETLTPCDAHADADATNTPVPFVQTAF